MDIKTANAEIKYLRISPSKLRRVADVVRGQKATTALQTLRLMPHAGARYLYKAIHSAMANATNNHSMNESALQICALTINEGARLKRFRAIARGRIYKIIKRTSHISVVLKES